MDCGFIANVGRDPSIMQVNDQTQGFSEIFGLLVDFDLQKHQH